MIDKIWLVLLIVIRLEYITIFWDPKSEDGPETDGGSRAKAAIWASNFLLKCPWFLGGAFDDLYCFPYPPEV